MKEKKSFTLSFLRLFYKKNIHHSSDSDNIVQTILAPTQSPDDGLLKPTNQHFFTLTLPSLQIHLISITLFFHFLNIYIYIYIYIYEHITTIYIYIYIIYIYIYIYI